MSSPDLVTLFHADKMIAVQPDWAQIDSECLMVVSSLQIDDVVFEGLRFRATAKKRLPDEMLTFQIEYHPPQEIGGPLCRLEWRPLSGHNNRGRGPREWQQKQIIGCHHHTFELNQRYAAKDMAKGLLPIAIPLAESPSDFNSLLDLVKKEFRISNIDWLEPPPWEPTLL